MMNVPDVAVALRRSDAGKEVDAAEVFAARLHRH